MKESSRLQHESRLKHVAKCCGSGDIDCMYNYLMSATMNPFTKRTYLLSLTKHANINDKVKFDIYDYCKYLRQLGYREHKKYKNLVSLNEVKQMATMGYPQPCWEKMLVLLYCEWPLRDNIPSKCLSISNAAMHLSNTKNGILPEDNFFYVHENKVHCFVGKTKTVPKVYQPIDRIMSEEFSVLFRTLVKANENSDVQVFPVGKGRNDKLIARLLRGIGVEGGSINYMRRVHRQAALETKDMNVIRENARLSFHSLDTANDYNH